MMSDEWKKEGAFLSSIHHSSFIIHHFPEEWDIEQRILFVIPSLEYGGDAGQLVELLKALPREQFQCRVVVLGGTGPWAERLRQDAIEVDAPGRDRLFDLRPLVRLRE